MSFWAIAFSHICVAGDRLFYACPSQGHSSSDNWPRPRKRGQFIWQNPKGQFSNRAIVLHRDICATNPAAGAAMLRLLLSEGLSPSLSHAHVCVISHKCGLGVSSLERLGPPLAGLFLSSPQGHRDSHIDATSDRLSYAGLCSSLFRGFVEQRLGPPNKRPFSLAPRRPWR